MNQLRMVSKQAILKIWSRLFLQSYRELVVGALLMVSAYPGSETVCKGQSPGIRPKVGLALSGGGACGMAHVGVLKVMEEAGLRPDYITGVSMGSIIGGMFSIGYSADSLEHIISTIDWDNVLSNRISENKVIFPEKKHYMNSILSLPLTFKKVILPAGLSNGQQIESTISYFDWPAADINDFLKLPIPFICLASDIVNNKKVILKTGYLPDAIRASIAVPSLLTPVKTDSSVLIDGGFIRNFAVTELKDMGADIIIGSYTGFKKHNVEDVETITDVVKQIGLINSFQDFEKQKKLVNVLIEPNVDDFSPTRFKAADSLIRRGYEAALPFKGYFRHLADSLNSIAPQKPLKNIFYKKEYSFNRIAINGNKVYSDEQIMGVLDIKPGQKVDRDNLKDKIDLLYGKSWFEKVKYRFVKNGDSLILSVDCVEKPRAMLYGSVHYDNALRAGAIVGLSVKDPLIQKSELNLNSFIGQYYRFTLDYIQYIDKPQKYGISVSLYADNTFVPMMKMFNETGGTNSRSLIPGLSLVRRFGLNHLLNLSGEYEVMSLDHSYTSDSDKEKLISDYATASVSYSINTLNTKHFPDNGIYASFNLKTSKLLSADYRSDTANISYGKNEANPLDSKMFYTIQAGYDQYFTRYKKWTLCAGAQLLYISITDSLSSLNNCYFLGGIEQVSPRSIPMTGFHPLQIQVNKLAGVHLDIDYEIFDKVHLNISTAIAAIEDSAKPGTISLLAGITTGAGYMSVIGPVKAGIMYGFYKNEQNFNRLKGYISIGFNF